MLNVEHALLIVAAALCESLQLFCRSTRTESLFEANLESVPTAGQLNHPLLALTNEKVPTALHVRQRGLPDLRHAQGHCGEPGADAVCSNADVADEINPSGIDLAGGIEQHENTSRRRAKHSKRTQDERRDFCRRRQGKEARAKSYNCKANLQNVLDEVAVLLNPLPASFRDTGNLVAQRIERNAQALGHGDTQADSPFLQIGPSILQFLRIAHCLGSQHNTELLSTLGQLPHSLAAQVKER